ncbi:MAG TPA: PilC/PilY family type IV pilus protein [Myxococcota bacterium]|nr:PilC/PilY family type IV pilus protein [Myxococcota bacterium]
MTRRAALVAFGTALAALASWAPARAQGIYSGDDPLLALPDVFVIIDTSGSMAGGWYPCGSGTAAGFCSAQLATREVLTGTYLWQRGTCGDLTRQSPNGILDIYKDLVRFGFATFDDDRPCGCGWCRGSTVWNYPAWGTGDSKASKGQIGIKQRGAVGGGLVDLVDPADPTDILGNNVKVQDGACAAGATGCTPLNASLWDARWYYTHWTTEVTPAYTDPMELCRRRFVLLMTDGGNNGPWDYGYSSPEQEAFNLFSMGIPVFVVGFGDVRPWTDPIAYAGSGGLVPSFVADNPLTLYLAFSAVLDAILSGAASRTEMTSVASSLTYDKSFQFAAYFEVSLSGIGWQGHLIRIPVILDGDGNPQWTPQAQWTRFDEVLAAQNSNSRRLYTVVHDPRSSTFLASQLPRPVSANPDDGLYSFEAGLHDTDPWMCLWDSEGIGVPALSDKIKNFVRGVPGTTSVGDKVTVTAPWLGDIFHSSPAVVTAPSALGEDFKYEFYFRNNIDRHTMVYVGANDGMLHAFVAEDVDGVGADETGRELWAFIPNQLLHKIQNVRVRHDYYVDNTPVVRDVYFKDVPLLDKLGNPVKDAANQPILGAYRTVLFGSLRGGGSGYFALDVTDPQNPKYLWEYRPDVDISLDYSLKQCSGSRAFSHSQPVVGQVWLKDANASAGDPPYISKPVMIVPGGYVPTSSLLNVMSCIDFVEGLILANSVHVIDVETGKLLKRFLISEAVNAGNQALLDDFYNTLATDPTSTWNHIGNGNNFDGEGWWCDEKRLEVQNPPYLPPELLDYCTVTETDTLYQKDCCYNPGTGMPGCNGNGTTPCHYTFQKPKNVAGGVYIFLKTEGCDFVDHEHQGRFELSVDQDFMIESMAGTPVAYNVHLGEYITSAFFPTTKGRVYQVGFETALYKDDGLETEKSVVSNMLIQPNVAGATTYLWDVGRVENDPTKPPSPWFDMQRDAGLTPRPIMVPPTLALNYERNLVLFFGTGENDTFEVRTAQEYFFGVEQTLSGDASSYRTPDAVGYLDPQMRLALGAGERMWGKPFVAGGNVYYTTYIANPNRCEPGTGRLYGLDFDDFTTPVIAPFQPGVGGPLTSPSVVFTPDGRASLTLPVGTSVYTVTVPGLAPSAQMIHWGRVL